MKKKKPAPEMYTPKTKTLEYPKFSGKFSAKKPRRFAAEKLELLKVLGPTPRDVFTEGIVIKSVPMGAGGTVPYDESLEEAKAALAWRTGPLYNKGGPQYISDGDMGDVKSGLTRRRS
jgi:hypothetical protein